MSKGTSHQIVCDQLWCDESAVERPGAVAQASVALAGAAASIEMFAYAERHPTSGFARAFRAPGFVGTPPALTTISFPARVRAVSTATSRDQPPLAAIDVCTVGVP